MCIPEVFRTVNDPISDNNNAVVVVPVYRTCIEAQYPAAVNDLHAVYQWIIENADMLNANPDNITLTGISSGGHLALALAFRLKRYGYRPRGCVASLPITDDRLTKDCSRVYISDSDWSGEFVRENARMWLGENYGAPYIGPEAYANRATVEECRGLCPVFINTCDLDADVEYSLEFVGKLLRAGVYVDYHIMSGMCHTMMYLEHDADEDIANFAGTLTRNTMRGVHECLTYDLRRSCPEL